MKDRETARGRVKIEVNSSQMRPIASLRPQRADPRRHGMADTINNDPTGDGIDRRGFLKCMAWAGTGLLCTMSGGILTSLGLPQAAEAKGKAATGTLSFV